jgi:putative DNA primase/helicase
VKIIIQNNGSFDIATGRHRWEKSWKNRQMEWNELVEKLSVTHRTAEAYTEYLGTKKLRQDEIKDIGGFVGGYLNGGRRLKGRVMHRQLLTLDIDFAKPDTWQDFTMIYGCAAVVYSTHKHSSETPRLRLIIPLDRPVTSDEYMAIARRIASVMDIDIFDHTTFQPERLMYWPSTSKDGDFLFHYQDGQWLSADDVLKTYHDWRDSSEWPVSSREGTIIQKQIQKQGDPLEKTGVIGAFCRTYSVTDVLEIFLSDVYEPCDIEGRYTYKEGSTAAGLVIYEDKYAYSHHGTDPISGKLCNAFDLVRLHKFGLRDEDARDDTPNNRLPSYVAMQELASKDTKVKLQIGVENLKEAAWDFNNDLETIEETDAEWMSELDVDRKGKYHPTIDNIILILENDPMLKGRVGFNEFEQRECIIKALPWARKKKDEDYFTDSDVSSLVHYLEKRYDISSASKTDHALKIIFSRYSFNPIKDYLTSVQWDGTERVDNLFIDYLGAEDSDYVKAATRKVLVAAVARIFEPGTKFDYMLTLVGKQGIGKSSLIQKLAVNTTWYSESFSTIHGKEAQESVQGVWLGEMGELAGLKKADVETIKHFISTRYDRYRVAYGKRTENFPRQCIIFGTTNNRDFLKDQTGNRRFWPIDATKGNPTKNIHRDLTRSEIDQVWAEAVTLYRLKEPLFLPANIEEMATDVQKEFTEKDDRVGIIQKYLDTKLPANWEDMSIWDRRSFIQGTDELQAEGVTIRDQVCIAELWCELFGGQARDITSFNTKDLHTIMQNMPGWERSKTNRRFKIYGQQRTYIRVDFPEKRVNGHKKRSVHTDDLL